MLVIILTAVALVLGCILPFFSYNKELLEANPLFLIVGILVFIHAGQAQASETQRLISDDIAEEDYFGKTPIAPKIMNHILNFLIATHLLMQMDLKRPFALKQGK